MMIAKMACAALKGNIISRPIAMVSDDFAYGSGWLWSRVVSIVQGDFLTRRGNALD